VRTRSGHVVNQWVVAGVIWGLALGPAALAMWWAYRLGIDSPEIWLAPLVGLMSISALALFVTLAGEFVSALRQVRGHEPRGPWLSFSYENDGADPELWEIPKLW
jgi:hypothetical protein